MRKSSVKENAEQKAYRLIVDLIKLEYKPGDFLLEVDLAEKLQMSRTPVNSALRALLSQGVLQKLPKKGCCIPNINKEDAQKLFLARKTLESAAAILFSQIAGNGAVQMAGQILEDTQKANDRGDYLGFASLDEKFHHTIVRAADNKYIYDAWCPIYFRCNLYTRFFDKFYTKKTDMKEHTMREHRHILDAIAANDAQKAQDLVCAHIERALRFVVD